MTDPTAPLDPEVLPANELALWAYEARQAHSIAQSLANTSFVPVAMRHNIGDITGAILAGRELGMKPIAAVRSIDIIQGTPSLRAITMRALVQSRGHEIEVVESTDDRCIMRGRRAGSEGWQTVEWDIERARLMGLTGKQQWKIQPRAMLVARATSEIARLIAADVILAMPYTTEELDLDRPAVAQISVQRESTGRVTLEEITDTPHTAEAAEGFAEEIGEEWPEIPPIGAPVL